MGQRVVAIAVAVVAALFVTGRFHVALPSAQSGTQGRTERWASLNLEVQELVLGNGLRILLVEDHRSPRVAASLYYRVGALQEGYGDHGSTHFLEHAIHQGTTTVGVKDWAADRALLDKIWQTEQQLLAEQNAFRNKLRERNVFFDEGDWPTNDKIDALRKKLYELEDEQSKNRIFWEEYNWYRRNGGIMRHGDPVPANTGNEMMRIEVDLPSERLEMFFRLEADRMVNAVLRGWEAQRFTVFEQFLVLQRNETGRFNEALNGVTGVAHPIFIHTGGHHRDHAYWNRESMLRLYDQYIVPNNATLALVGAMKMDAVRPLAEKYFGRVPRAPEPPYRMDVEAEPPPGGTVRLDWLEPLDPQLIVRYRIPSVGHPDRPAFDIIARVLRGPDGVLAAVQKGGPDWQANASQNGSPNTFSMSARPGRDEDFPVLERTIAMAVDRLKREPVDDARLARIRREFAFEWDLLRSERGGLASQLANYSTIDEWRTMRTYLEARNTTTAADIQRVAAKYFVPWNQIIATTRRNPQTPARDNLTGPRGSKRSQGSGGAGGSGGAR